MKHSFLLPALFLSLLFLSSCISKKKFLETTTVYDQQLDSLQQLLDTSSTRIYELEMKNAFRRGENEALLATQDRLQDRIIALDDEIERLLAESANRVESLDSRLQEKDAAIAARDGRIRQALEVIQKRDVAMESVHSNLLDTLKQVDSTAYSFSISNGQLSLSFQLDFLFYPGSTNKTHSAGRQALENVSRVLANYPGLDILVVGHTDNSPLRRSSIDDKWEFTAMQAAEIVRLMTKKYELSTSRLMVAGKGEFEPRASNASPEGRALNQRMEIRIFPRQESLLRDLRRALE